MILAGDFNYNLMKHEKNKYISEFLNFMTTNLFTPHIIRPTRFVEGQRPSLVDNIFVNDKHFISGNLYNKISDHMPNFIIIQDIEAQYSIKAKMYKRDMSNFDENEFLNAINTEQLLDTTNKETDLNIKYDKFEEHVTTILNKHAPLKELSKRKAKESQMLPSWHH